MSHNFALVGNPNCGKTTLFNYLTGSNQKVGNWPGVTVEKKTGSIKRQGEIISITDLPGIYSLAPYSIEEVIASDYILSGQSDLIINILDATTIERGLFLSTQLMETGVPMVIALNFMDIVEKDGTVINVEEMEKSLGVPVIPISASRGYGIDDIIPIALHTLHDLHYHGEAHGYHEKHGHAQPHEASDRGTHITVHNQPQMLEQKGIYSSDIQTILNTLEEILSDIPHSKWMAVRYFEDGEAALKKLNISTETLNKLRKVITDFQKTKTIDRDMILADARYTYICDIVQKNVKHGKSYHELSISDKIDRVLTNRILAIPIFLAVMLGMFWLSFGFLGTFLTDIWTEILDTYIFGGIMTVLENGGASEWTLSLVGDGIIAGVSSVLGFLPQIAVLFLCLSLLEASGYMSRAAFIMDRLFRKFGLSGKSFVPMLMGFGCSVPAIMAARTLENERERRLTIMITPFISCSARLPVYAVFAAAFFSENQPLIIFSLYLMSVAVAILSGLFLKGFVLRNQQSNFIMELPAYHLPSLKRIWIDTWEKVRGFIVRAGTLILSASIVVWILQTFDFTLHRATDSSQSMFGVIGGFIAPVFAPLGFGNWQSSMSLITGFIAKEAVVGTLGILYTEGGGATSPDLLTNALQSAFTSASAYSFMVFTLLYLPCIAAFSTLKRELNSWKWTLITVSYQTGVAWVFAFFVYQVAKLFV